MRIASRVALLFMTLTLSPLGHAESEETAMHRAQVAARCGQYIEGIVLTKALADFKAEASYWKTHPLAPGAYTQSKNDLWKLTPEVELEIFYIGDARPFDSNPDRLPDGRVEFATRVAAIFPKPENNGGGSLGYFYEIKSRLKPIRIVGSDPDRNLSPQDFSESEGYLMPKDGQGGCAAEVNQYAYLPARPAELGRWIAYEDLVRYFEVFKKALLK